MDYVEIIKYVLQGYNMKIYYILYIIQNDDYFLKNNVFDSLNTLNKKYLPKLIMILLHLILLINHIHIMRILVVNNAWVYEQHVVYI